MKRSRTISAWLFLASVLLTSVCLAAGSPSIERIKHAGKITVAMDATFPPMEFEGKDGKPIGFDVDVAEAIAKQLGVKCEFVVMNWDGILAGLASKRYDTIISGMNITSDRLKQVNFVEYAKMSQVFVTAKGQAVVAEKDLAGKVVAVQADTTSADFLEKAIKNGLKIKEVKQFKSAADAFAAIKSKQAEVVVIDEPVGRYYAKQSPSSFQVTGRALAPEPIGVAINKNDADLTKELQRIVDNMRKDGTLKKLQEQWFGTELGQ